MKYLYIIIVIIISIILLMIVLNVGTDLMSQPNTTAFLFGSLLIIVVFYIILRADIKIIKKLMKEKTIGNLN
jgi:hypothetical protein